MASPRERVVIVDFGMGNLHSVHQALRRAGEDLPVDIAISQDPDAVRAADRVILPGQGAMRDCMSHLQDTGMADAVRDIFGHQPLLGICVGLQMLLEHSAEHDCAGLGLLPGQSHRFDLALSQEDGSRITVPQMGWNAVWQHSDHPLWAGIANGSPFYFLHSYYALMARQDDIAGEADYGLRYCCALQHGSVFATQFHPEKSARAGLQLLRNFLRWQPQARAQ